MKRFTLGDFTAAGAEILDGRDMSVAKYNAKDEADARAFVRFRNELHDARVHLDNKEATQHARAKKDFEGRFGDSEEIG